MYGNLFAAILATDTRAEENEFSFPGPPQEVNEVLLPDAVNVFRRVTSCRQRGVELREVGDGVEILRRLLRAETTVEVAADADVARITGELADVVHVGNDVIESYAARLRRGLPPDPAGNQHPRIERAPNHRFTGNQFPKLLVAELAHVGNERPAVLMAGPERAAKKIERLPKTLVAKMRDIENKAKPFDFPQQFASKRVQSAAGLRARSINARPVVRGTNGAQTVGNETFEVLWGEYRVRPFQREDIADGRV